MPHILLLLLGLVPGTGTDTLLDECPMHRVLNTLNGVRRLRRCDVSSIVLRDGVLSEW
jgi:hypothetical protein